MKVLNAIKYVWKAFFSCGDDADFGRYVIVKKIAESIYPKLKLSSYGRAYLDDDVFLDYYRRMVSTLDFSSLDRRYTLDQLVRHALTLGPGDTAECGVFRGASSYLICKRLEGTGRTHHLFDSFAGISAPTGEDAGCAWGKGEFACPEKQVRENLKSFPYAAYHKGWIPQRFVDVAESKFVFVHIDVDLYQPTFDSVVFFYDRMVPGGIILCDDYGMRQAPGAQKALDDFFATRPEVVMNLPTGQGLVVKALT